GWANAPPPAAATRTTEAPSTPLLKPASLRTWGTGSHRRERGVDQLGHLLLGPGLEADAGVEDLAVGADEHEGGDAGDAVGLGQLVALEEQAVGVALALHVLAGSAL